MGLTDFALTIRNVTLLHIRVLTTCQGQMTDLTPYMITRSSVAYSLSLKWILPSWYVPEDREKTALINLRAFLSFSISPMDYLLH